MGPIPKDHIITHKGEEIKKFGCVTHPTIALAKLLVNKGTVYPVTHVRKADESKILELFSDYDAINAEHINSSNDQGDEIRLEFVDQNTRIEKQTAFMNPILPEDLNGLMHCDIFIGIPITDYEVPLQTLKHIRTNSDGIIIFDGHGPTHGVTKDGQRFIKLWKDRDEWLPYIDVLKMNLIESKCAWFEDVEEGTQLPDLNNEGTDHLLSLAEHVLHKGVKALVVTLDARGSALFYIKDGKVEHTEIPAMEIDEVVDTTGCGDSFAGGLGYGLLENPTNYRAGVKYANVLGALRAQGRTFDVFKSAEETENLILDNYNKD